MLRRESTLPAENKRGQDVPVTKQHEKSGPEDVLSYVEEPLLNVTKLMVRTGRVYYWSRPA